MAATVNPDFVDKLKKLGAFDLQACYNCGNCTAICPLSTEDNSFPRKMIRYTLLGLEGKIVKSPDPWLCYYCGECSDTCPREADPAALMMASRRFVIRKYSIGRIADWFYSGLNSTIAWIILSLIAIIGIFFFKEKTPNYSEVDFMSFISPDLLHYAGMALGIIVIFFIITNIYIMVKSIALKKKKVKFKLLIKKFWNVLVDEIIIQKKFRECENGSRYIPHLSLFYGFIGLLMATTSALIIYFIAPAQTEWKIIPKLLGIISGIALIYGSGYYIYIRAAKKDTYSKYSHHTDWIFLLLMFSAGLSGFFMDIFKLFNLPMVAYIAFAVHLIIVFNLLITAPFTKFAHALYRPIAILLSNLYKDG